jgi:hypothetical protein
MDFADETAWIEEEEAAEEEARKRARIEVEFPPFILIHICQVNNY